MRTQLTPRETKPAQLRPSRLLYTGALLLVAIAVAVVRFTSGSAADMWPKAVIAVAVLLLVFRLLSRRVKRNIEKASQPDPESRLHLD